MGQVRHVSDTIEPWCAIGSSTMARARRQSSNTAIRWLASVCLQTLRSASFARAAEPGAGHQRQDGREMAETGNSRGSEDRTDGTPVHRVF